MKLRGRANTVAKIIRRASQGVFRNLIMSLH
jgi:hypothetical protein